jgi:hypothetical protein
MRLMRMAVRLVVMVVVMGFMLMAMRRHFRPPDFTAWRTFIDVLFYNIRNAETKLTNKLK